MAEKKAPPPATQYWAYRGSEGFWTVRSLRHQWPDQSPAYIADTIDDLLSWMTAKEIDRMELIPVGGEKAVVCVRWMLVRVEPLTPGELKTEKAKTPINRSATPAREDGRRSKKEIKP